MKNLKERMLAGAESVQGSAEWKAFRRFKVGCSAAPVIDGVSPWQTPLQLYDEIIAGEEKVVTEAMQRGKDNEGVARQKLCEYLGLQFDPCVVMHPTLGWHYSSLDGIAFDDARVVVCEIKCPNANDHALARSGAIPSHYLPQCLHILESVPEADALVYASYHNEDLCTVTISPLDYPKEMKELLAKERDFYDCLCTLQEPEACDRDWVQLDDEKSVQEFKLAATALDKAKADFEIARAKVLEHSEDYCRYRLGELSVQKIVRRGAVDYAKVPELQGVDLERYRKANVISWRVDS